MVQVQLIQRKLNRKRFRLPCDPHIFLLHWTIAFGLSVSILGRFKSFWNEINPSKYPSVI